MSKIPHRLYLTEDQMPQKWFNLRSAMAEQPDPLLHPGTLRPLGVDDLSPIFCEELARQELDGATAYVDIPEPIQNVYKMYRPSPLIRAYELEKALDTPARIYYKFEGNNTSGSHKLNSAVAQAYYAKMQGLTGVTTETGAGQWGTALSEACSYFSLTCDVFMVKCSYEQKPFRKAVMNCIRRLYPPPLPPPRLRWPPDPARPPGDYRKPGLRHLRGGGVRRPERRRQALCAGQRAQPGAPPPVHHRPGEQAGHGAAGGISRRGGGLRRRRLQPGRLIAPFMADKLRGIRNPRIVAVEPASCPSLTRGKYAYDFCDTGRVTPLARMYTLGCGFIPSANHAGGLRYHGMSPILSKLYHDGYMEAVAYEQTRVFEAAVLFAKRETILPAPESAHAIRGAIDEALRCRESREAKTILFGLTGTGYFDMTAYENYLSGKMSDSIPTDADLQKGFDSLPKIPQNEGI